MKASHKRLLRELAEGRRLAERIYGHKYYRLYLSEWSARDRIGPYGCVSEKIVKELEAEGLLKDGDIVTGQMF